MGGKRSRTARTKREVAPAPSSRRPWGGLIALLVILLVAAVLRVALLSQQAPPGLNQDEAANAWNAWCLLHTGRDQTGESWPIFYTRALGANRSTLYIYATIPFQVLGGLSVFTNRLPSAVAGVLTIFLLYWIAKRLFNQTTGLVAAALLALNPWHIYLSRIGHEAGISPLLTVIPIAVLLWAGFPLRDGEARPIIWRAAVAGLVIGVCCYGYPAVRLYIPIVLACCVLLTVPAWWCLLRSRAGTLAILVMLLGVVVTFGPLLYQHIKHPEQIARRSKGLLAWRETDSVDVRLGKVAGRYAMHFGPTFLFKVGDYYETQSPRGFGQYHWYMLPLMIAGLAWPLKNAFKSRAARILFCVVLLYPVADCMHHHSSRAPDGTVQFSAHALRSAPGVWGPILLAAVGTTGAYSWLARKWRIAAVVALAITALVLNARFISYFFGEYNRRPLVYETYHVDLMEAYAWLRPQVDSADAVFVTTNRIQQPYMLLMVALGYDAEQWFRDEREIHTRGWWDQYYRVGKFNFMYGPAGPALDNLQQNGRPDRVIFILRPGQVNWPDPAHTVLGPDGQPSLQVYIRQM